MPNADFGPKHLTGLLWLFTLIGFMLAITLLIKKVFKKGEKYDRAVVRYTAYFMWAWEIVKTFRMVNAADYGPVGHYPVWMAPFHICSMGLYAYLIIGSKRGGKFADFVKPFGFGVMLIVTSIILIIPASSGIMGPTTDWKFTYENILPYQSFLYHGCLVFVPLYMLLSGFYKPKFVDIFKALAVLFTVATFAQILNFAFDGSGADYMTLRYGNGNPFQFLLQGPNPWLYYVVLFAIVIFAVTFLFVATILLRLLARLVKKLIKLLVEAIKQAKTKKDSAPVEVVEEVAVVENKESTEEKTEIANETAVEERAEQS